MGKDEKFGHGNVVIQSGTVESFALANNRSKDFHSVCLLLWEVGGVDQSYLLSNESFLIEKSHGNGQESKASQFYRHNPHTQVDEKLKGNRPQVIIALKINSDQASEQVLKDLWEVGCPSFPVEYDAKTFTPSTIGICVETPYERSDGSMGVCLDFQKIGLFLAYAEKHGLATEKQMEEAHLNFYLGKTPYGKGVGNFLNSFRDYESYPDHYRTPFGQCPKLKSPLPPPSTTQQKPNRSLLPQQRSGSIADPSSCTFSIG